MEEQNKYDLDLRRYSSNRKRFPWSIITRVLVGLGFVALLWYALQKIGEEKKLPPQQEQGIEVEIEERQ